MIEVVRVSDRDAGNLKARDILRTEVDHETLLALSGGTSPDYRKILAGFADVIPGAISVVDERYGAFYHENSNELLFKSQGVVDFCHDKNIKFHRILTGKSFEETASEYDAKLRSLFRAFRKKIGVMGVGTHFHTAGIFPGGKAARSIAFAESEHVEDKFPKRITMTFKALEQFTLFVVLIFGEEKREVLLKMLDENENDKDKYPAVFYRVSGIKTFIVTDLEV